MREKNIVNITKLEAPDCDFVSVEYHPKQETLILDDGDNGGSINFEKFNVENCDALVEMFVKLRTVLL